jgi:Transposase domain (DUF772)
MWGESAMAEARVVRPDRRQLGWDMVDLEGLLPADHRARIVWSFVESLDLSQLYERVKSREGEAGRPAADPAVMLALWLYATVEGVGSARALERLAGTDAAYRWLAGGVPLKLSRARRLPGRQRRGPRPAAAAKRDRVDRRGTDEVLRDRRRRHEDSRQRQQGVVQDGRKIAQDRSRGWPERLAALKQELTDDPGASSRRRQAARERAARDVQARAGRARAALERLEAERKARAKTHSKDEARKKEPRASTSEP